jgi:hypothetical protein
MTPSEIAELRARQHRATEGLSGAEMFKLALAAIDKSHPEIPRLRRLELARDAVLARIEAMRPRNAHMTFVVQSRQLGALQDRDIDVRSLDDDAPSMHMKGLSRWLS